LAQFLSDEGIKATFFMVGRHIEQHPSIAPEVFRLGHIVGNHSFSHAVNLPDSLATGLDIVSEIRMTDELISQYNPSKDIYFRAPWGPWSDDVARNLNDGLGGDLNHIGPYFWDIECSDWRHWQLGHSAEECANEYINAVNRVGRGIILMHDSTADIEEARLNNRTYETIKIIVPTLKRQGYKFIGLSEVPT
jgi:peptidoglycan/xylan/chitin deacetylase (PgdA/CDA1 family)